MKTTYHIWTADEAQQLTDVTIECTVNGKINWDDVMQHFPNNSKTQLKSYFQKQLRTGSIYFKWTAEDEQ
ncbi:MAG: hypothetical protein EOM41_12815, partial [Bacilli bacterium]|nr:hypothetical protein [Bacilli bacterium]